MNASKKHHLRIGVLSLVLLILIGVTLACRTLLPEESTTSTETEDTQIETPGASDAPSDEVIEPTAVVPPTSPPVLDCQVDSIVARARDAVPYAEFSVLTNRVLDFSFLNIWFVDTSLDPLASGSAIDDNVSVAEDHAIQLAHQLLAGDYCIADEFDVMNPIVVDRDYNGWLSVNFEAQTLAQHEVLDGIIMESIKREMAVGYARQVTTDPRGRQAAPGGSCSWSQALDGLWTHFSRERMNVGFYMVIDETGINVYAQWDGPTDALMYASLANVGMELVCLHPAIESLNVTIVDEGGNIKLIGRVAGHIVRANDTGALIGGFEILAQP